MFLLKWDEVNGLPCPEIVAGSHTVCEICILVSTGHSTRIHFFNSGRSRGHGGGGGD